MMTDNCDTCGEAARDVIGTYTGRLVSPWNMKAADLDIAEIAHALALVNRFCGHTRVPYSVAQHSCLVSDHCGPDALTRLAGLLHDASEAYLGDVVTPIKRREEMNAYRDAEYNLMREVKTRWRLWGAHWGRVDDVDAAACTSEARSLFMSVPAWTLGRPKLDVDVEAWGWRKAEREFLWRFCGLASQLDLE